MATQKLVTHEPKHATKIVEFINTTLLQSFNRLSLSVLVIFII